MLTVTSRHAPALLGVICTLTSAAWGAERPRLVARNILADIRVESNLVLIPVSVTDSKNHAVIGLGREAFRVFEGRAEQTVAQFACEDAPLSVGIVFDSSGSMHDKIAQSREAVARFLDTSNPEDEFYLVDFNSTARLSEPFTRDAGLIQNRLTFTTSGGRTALLDAVYLAIDALKKSRNSRRALLIISDGGDNDSRYTAAEIRRRVREADLRIYAIGIYSSGVTYLPEESSGEALLAGLAEESGGRHFAVHDPNKLPDVAEKIGLELRNQYVIGYRPAGSARIGKYHRVQVKVEGRDLRVTWRPGYFD